MAKLSSTQIFGNLVVDGEIINKATTTTEGVVQLNDATNSTSTTQAATANAVKKAYDLAAGKAASSHTHNYAGSSSAGGAATSALACTGNAGTATKLQTSRTLTVGNTGKKFDGSGNVSWSLSEIGAAPTSHGTHVTYSTTAPAAPGTASAGTASTVARTDHVHPAQTSVSGNAGTATKLQTARTINGTAFNGSANITTANWGTARTLTVGNTGKSVNGSGNVSWSLAEIGALPLAGGTISSSEFAPLSIQRNNNTYAASIGFRNSNGILGFIGMAGNANSGLVRWTADTTTSTSGTAYTILDTGNFKSHVTPSAIGALPLSGGTMTGLITTPNNAQGIKIGDDAVICDRDIANHIVIEGSTATSGGITFGSGKDTNIYRGGANLLKTDDTFNAVGGFQWNGESLDTRYRSLHKNAYIRITVNGDADTYYPVYIKPNGTSYPNARFSVSRGYRWTAPSTWNTSTHKGGLTFTFTWNGDSYWGGNGGGSGIVVEQFMESYCNMVAGLGNPTGGGVIVWLRGGGALYQIDSDYGTEISATVYLDGYTDSASKTFSARTDRSAVTDEISKKWISRSTSGVFDNNNRVYSPSNPQTTITGNAATATKLQTARTINGTSFDGSRAITTANWGTARTLTVGNTGKSVNGSGNVSWSLAEIGAAPTSHGTHVTYSTTAPAAPGTASAGTASTVARTDHVHPAQTTVSGNAGTATKLKTARTINGTSFDGSAAITTANWGTARTLTVGNTSKSVNGSGNVSWSLAEIGALSTTGKAADSDKLDGIDSTGFGRAYSSAVNFGGNKNGITTAQFITLITNLGAFKSCYWVARGSWSYATNQIINDTGCGNIHLAGSVVEVIGDQSAYTIRITTPTTSAGGTENSEFIYINNGLDYIPGWRRIYNMTVNSSGDIYLEY